MDFYCRTRGFLQISLIHAEKYRMDYSRSRAFTRTTLPLREITSSPSSFWFFDEALKGFIYPFDEFVSQPTCF
jgi:hypothetical protein